MYKKVVYVFFYFKKHIFLFFICFIACCVMFSLITFSPFDDSCFQFTGNEVYHNVFGKLGAICSDILFFLFGLPAYVIPCIILLLVLDYLFEIKNSSFYFFNLVNKIFGGIILLFSLCGLLEFYVLDFYYCYSGGVVGVLFHTYILYKFKNIINSNVILILFMILGVMLLIQPLCLLIFFKKIKNLIFQLYICYHSYCVLKITDVTEQCLQIILKVFIVINDFIMFILKNFKQKFSYIFFKIVFIIKYIVYNIYIPKFFYLLFGKSCVGNIKNYILKFKNSNYRTVFFKTCALSRLINNKLTIRNTLYEMSNLNSSNQIFQYTENNFIKNKKIIKKKNSSELQSINNVFLPIKQTRFSLRKLSNLLPNINLLFSAPYHKKYIDMDFLKQQSILLESKLADYHIKARVVNIVQGPVIIRFEIDLSPGIKSARISSLSRDLARSLSICHLKVVEVIPGKPYIGLEIPNKNREIIYLREVLDTEAFRLSHDFLTFGLGKDVSGEPVIANLHDMPHLLMAGTTGSGKSVGINSIIISILYKATPADVRFIMIDPKILELSIYKDIPHLLRNVITDIQDVISVLNWCVDEMERRYKIMAYYGVRNLKSYNDYVKLCKKDKLSVDPELFSNINSDNTSAGVLEKLPYIVIIIDEFADLIMSDSGKQVELLIIRLSQKARACGMHLILATQRPSVNVITGLIKANIPSRIAFSVSSKIDSRTILDQSGAETLLGNGDMFYLSSHSPIPIRVHGSFVSDKEVALVVQYLKNIYYENTDIYEE